MPDTTGSREGFEADHRDSVELGLEPRSDKTRIIHLAIGGEGLDFLGFHHRWVRGREQHQHLRFLARWPSRKAMQHARDRIRELTARPRLLLEVDTIVEDINLAIDSDFRYGNSTRMFDKIRTYAVSRPALFVAKRHKLPRSYGWKVVVHLSANQLGLINLNGRVVTPRPNRAWRTKPNAIR